MKTISIGWLNKCRCGNKSHTVKTARGNETALWDDDAVKCNSCGREGVIQVCEGQARVLWETDEDMSERKPMTLTKEQLIERCKSQADYAQAIIDLYPDDVGAAESRRIAEIALEALAGMEAEPVSDEHIRREVNVGGNTWVQCSKRAFDKAKTEGKIVRELYERPQPASAAPDDFHSWFERVMRPAMITNRIQKAEQTMVFSSTELAWNACRAAMQSGAVKDGWVMVPVEMTPEQMRAVQINSELGSYAADNLSGAYSLFREFWDVAIEAAPQQEAE